MSTQNLLKSLCHHSVDCSITPLSITADPDISGFGILLTFIISACLTTFSAVAVVILRRRTYSLRSLCGISSKRKGRWQRFLERFLLALADQMIAYTLCIQTTALVKLCTISTYHMRIVHATAFLAGMTHIFSMILLQDYFESYPILRDIRLICIFLNQGLLLCTQWLSFRFVYRRITGAMPVVCFWMKPWDMAYAITNIGVSVLVLYLAIRILYLAKRWPIGFREKWLIITLVIIFVIGGFALAAATFAVTQALGKPEVPIDGSEKIWSFGQVMPLLFLVLPLLTAAEAFYEEALI